MSASPSFPPSLFCSPDGWGETIATSTTDFIAQCFPSESLDFPSPPGLGSWVKAADTEGDRDIYGIVCHTSVTPTDDIHRAQPLGLSQVELREQHPQIFALWRTEFRVATVGSVSLGPEIGTVSQSLPPRPPPIHQRVVSCKAAEIAHFCQRYDFLRALLRVTSVPTDELVAAVLWQSATAWAAVARTDPSHWLLPAGRTLAVLLRDDYDCLRSIITKLDRS